jgi:hypothetical protein
MGTCGVLTGSRLVLQQGHEATYVDGQSAASSHLERMHVARLALVARQSQDNLLGSFCLQEVTDQYAACHLRALHCLLHVCTHATFPADESQCCNVARRNQHHNKFASAHLSTQLCRSSVHVVDCGHATYTLLCNLLSPAAAHLLAEHGLGLASKAGLLPIISPLTYTADTVNAVP